jgi:hypothetical protein
MGDWPADSRIQTRSLATLFSRLDRGQDLSWLAERQAVQVALARVLGTPVDEVQKVVSTTLHAATADLRLVRLHDLPAARPLDLGADPLPPGFPPEAIEPGTRALWWVAPPDGGRTLVGRWLRARGRTVVLEGEAGSPVSSPPVYVDLGDGQEPPPPRPGLCVAASRPPPASSGFEVIHSPPLAEVAPELVPWAIERLPRTTRLSAESALPYLADRLASGLFRNWGALLGLIGLIDELGVRELSSRPLPRVAQRFVEVRVGRAVDTSMPYAGWLRRSLYPALVAMSERAFVESNRSLAEPRSSDAWMQLVPPELERNVDVDWMRLSLAQIDTNIRTRDVERAAKRLPPGAFRLVTTLEQAGLLRRKSEEALKLGPAWLRALLEREAIDALLSRSPFEWGEALLRPHAAGEIAEALLDRTLSGGASPLVPVLDLEAPEQPAYAAASDLAFRAAGVALLLGAEVPQEVLEGLFQANAELSVDLDPGPPLPRIELVSDEKFTREDAAARGRALLARGTYHLAALAISERMERRAHARLAALDPWHHTNPHPTLAAAYDEIRAALATNPPWRSAALLLIARARAVVGNVLGPEDPHPLEAPAQMLDEIQHGVLAFSTIEAAAAEPRWLDTILALADERDVSHAEVARSVWAAWDQAERPEGAGFLAPEAAERGLFWRYVPAPLLEALLVDCRQKTVPYEVFEDEQWSAFSRALVRAPELAGERDAWAAMPADWVAQLLRVPLDWSAIPECVGVLWRRFPELLSRAVQRQLMAGARADVDALGALLGGAPTETAFELLRDVEEHAPTLPRTALAVVRRVLRRTIAERAAEWRVAYAMLSQLELDLRALDRRGGADRA